MKSFSLNRFNLFCCFLKFILKFYINYFISLHFIWIFFLIFLATNLIKCKVSSTNLNEEKIYEIMKFEQKNEEERVVVIIDIEKFQSWAKFEFYHDLSQSERDFCISWLRQVTTRAAERINPDRFHCSRQESRIRSTRIRRKNFALAWKLVIYIILETLSQERDHLPWYVIGCEMFFTFFSLSFCLCIEISLSIVVKISFMR